MSDMETNGNQLPKPDEDAATFVIMPVKEGLGEPLPLRLKHEEKLGPDWDLLTNKSFDHIECPAVIKGCHPSTVVKREDLSQFSDASDLRSVPDMDSAAFIKNDECLVDTEGNEHEFMPEISSVVSLSNVSTRWSCIWITW